MFLKDSQEYKKLVSNQVTCFISFTVANMKALHLEWDNTEFHLKFVSPAACAELLVCFEAISLKTDWVPAFLCPWGKRCTNVTIDERCGSHRSTTLAYSAMHEMNNNLTGSLSTPQIDCLVLMSDSHAANQLQSSQKIDWKRLWGKFLWQYQV